MMEMMEHEDKYMKEEIYEGWNIWRMEDIKDGIYEGWNIWINMNEISIVTSSAPPPIEVSRMSLKVWSLQQQNFCL